MKFEFDSTKVDGRRLRSSITKVSIFSAIAGLSLHRHHGDHIIYLHGVVFGSFLVGFFDAIFTAIKQGLEVEK